MRVLKPETQVKNIMLTLLKEHGMKRIEANAEEGYFCIVPPNALGPGYVYISYPNHGKWYAHFKKDRQTLGAPKQQS